MPRITGLVHSLFSSRSILCSRRSTTVRWPQVAGSLKQGELIGMGGAFNALVGTIVDAIDERWVARAKDLKRFVPRTGKLRLLPDFVEAARVAAVTANEIAAPDAQPACYPYIDRVGLVERTRRRWWSGIG